MHQVDSGTILIFALINPVLNYNYHLYLATGNIHEAFNRRIKMQDEPWNRWVPVLIITLSRVYIYPNPPRMQDATQGQFLLNIV